MSINIAAIANAWYCNSRNHILAIMISGSARASWRNFLFWHVFYRVYSGFTGFEKYLSYKLDFWRALECTRLVEALLSPWNLNSKDSSILHWRQFCGTQYVLSRTRDKQNCITSRTQQIWENQESHNVWWTQEPSLFDKLGTQCVCWTQVHSIYGPGTGTHIFDFLRDTVFMPPD